MTVNKFRVGKYAFDSFRFYNENGESCLVFKEVNKLYDVGSKTKQNGFILFSNEKKRFTMWSPRDYPRFTFFIDVWNNIPAFLQIGKGFALITDGIMFVKNSNEMHENNGYVSIKELKDGLYRIILNVEMKGLNGRYYSDGKQGTERILKKS